MENTGAQTWYAQTDASNPRMVLRVRVDSKFHQQAHLRSPVCPGGRGHFIFELKAPARRGVHRLRLDLVTDDTPLSYRPAYSLVQTRLRVEDQP
jgi:hypothetical protein